MKDQEKLDKAVQFLAVWVPDHLRGQEAVDFINGYYEYMKEAVGKIADKAALVEDMSDLDTILNERKWAFIRSIESGAALGGKLENVDHFAKLNFKMMTLTWNGINELGSGSQSEMGLTDFGKAVVRRMEEVGMIVDCSHLNDAGFEDLLNCSAKPFVASHSNLRALCSHRYRVSLLPAQETVSVPASFLIFLVPVHQLKINGSLADIEYVKDSANGSGL